MPTGYTTVSATGLKDSTGSLIANATIKFTPVSNSGVPISFKAGSGGQTVSTPVVATVTNGAFTIQLADTTLTTPVNVGYAVTVVDNLTGDKLLGPGYGCVQPSGATWNFDTYVPNLAGQVSVQYGPPGPSAYQVYQAAGGELSTTDWLASLNGATTPNFEEPITVPGVKFESETALNAAVTVGDWGLTYTDGQGGIYWGISRQGVPLGLEASDIRLPSGTSAFGADLVLPGKVLLSAGIPDTSGAAIQLTDENGGVYANFDTNFNKILPASQVPVKSPCFSLNTAKYPFDPAAFTAVLNHVTMTGQSLAFGADAIPVLDTTAVFNNQRFSSGVNATTHNQANTLTSLNEVSVETCASSFAAQNSAFVGAATLSHQLLVSCSAIPGYSYAQLAGPTDYGGSGSPSFQEMMAQVAAGKTLAPSSYRHRAVLLIHGEQDSALANTNYATNLKTWQKDIQTGSQTITGDTNTIKMFMSQCIDTITGLQQLQAANDSPSTHVIVNPCYCVPHADPSTGAVNLHLSSLGQRIQGGYFNRAYQAEVLQGRSWAPTVPKLITVINNTIVIDYICEVTPIVIDSSYVTDPGNYGFLFTDLGGTSIVSITVSGPTQITISLSNKPSATGRTLEYATDSVIHVAQELLGPTSGPRGCVRDSCPATTYLPGASGTPAPLHNYGIVFRYSI